MSVKTLASTKASSPPAKVESSRSKRSSRLHIFIERLDDAAAYDAICGATDDPTGCETYVDRLRR